MSQPIVSVVTEITPRVNTYLSNQDPTTQTPLEDSQRKHPITTLFRPEKVQNPCQNNTETQHGSTTREEPPKNQGGYPELNT